MNFYWIDEAEEFEKRIEEMNSKVIKTKRGKGHLIIGSSDEK